MSEILVKENAPNAATLEAQELNNNPLDKFTMTNVQKKRECLAQRPTRPTFMQSILTLAFFERTFEYGNENSGALMYKRYVDWFANDPARFAQHLCRIDSWKYTRQLSAYFGRLQFYLATTTGKEAANV